MIAIHNLGRRPATADLDLGPGATGVHDLLADAEEPARRGRLSVSLDAYGGRWLRVRRR